MGRHRSSAEKLQVLVDVQACGLVGRARDGYIRHKHKMAVSTYYKWLREFTKADVAPTSHGIFSQLRSLSADDGDAIESDPADHPGYLEMLAAEQRKQEAPALEPEPARDPLVMHQVAVRRNGYRVWVHGERLPRQAGFASLNVSLPRDLYQRLNHEVRGSAGQAIPALLRYALDNLDFDGRMLEVFDSRKRKPEPHGITLIDDGAGAIRREALRKALGR